MQNQLGMGRPRPWPENRSRGNFGNPLPNEPNSASFTQKRHLQPRVDLEIFASFIFVILNQKLINKEQTQSKSLQETVQITHFHVLFLESSSTVWGSLNQSYGVNQRSFPVFLATWHRQYSDKTKTSDRNFHTLFCGQVSCWHGWNDGEQACGKEGRDKRWRACLYVFVCMLPWVTS